MINQLKQHKAAIFFTVIAVLLVSLAVINQTRNGAQSETEPETVSIDIIAVKDYHQEKTLRVENGIVESCDQADLKSQLSAQIAAINVRLGDYVQAGQTIMELQNNDIKAQVEQAQSRLAELKKGVREEELRISQTASEETKIALINSIKEAYVKSDDAIHNHIDKFFINPDRQNCQFAVNIVISDSNRVVLQPSDIDLAQNIAAEKYSLETTMANWQNSISNLSDDSSNEQINAAATLSTENLQKQINFMNAMSPLVNDFSSDSSTYKTIIDGYKTEFSASRSAINGCLSSLQGAQASWKTARQTLGLKLAGASDEQIKQAQAAVDALESTLAKTFIVSPISGKISRIDGHVGELAAMGTLLASVVNPDALRIKAYVSENDLSAISQNTAVKIDGGAIGILQTIAPAVDAQTRKAEINVFITENGSSPVIVGQTVGMDIVGKDSDSNQADYLLPIEAIQFTGSGNYVLTIGEDNLLEQIPVTAGDIVGEKIYIVEGLTDNMQIAASTRGLKAGDIVKIR